MKEIQRQQCLEVMGLTPWVARRPLPGARPSPELDWQEEAIDMPPRVVTGTPVASPQQPAAARTVPEARAQVAAEARKIPAAGQTKAAPSVSSTSRALRFTLVAYRVGDLWLVFQQEDPGAPGLGRRSGALADSLLRVFGGSRAHPRRFYCPLAAEPMDKEQASQAMTAFFSALARRSGGARVLFCLEESLTRALFDASRYQVLRFGGMAALVVSSLAEMLADPVHHKRASWRAMRAHDFDRRHD